MVRKDKQRNTLNGVEALLIKFCIDVSDSSKTGLGPLIAYQRGL